MDESDDLFSDESSFYGTCSPHIRHYHNAIYPFTDTEYSLNIATGSDAEIAELEEQVTTFDLSTYWTDIHPHLLSTIQYKLRSASALNPRRTDTKNQQGPRLNSRQTTESVPEFLSRLAPSTTRSSAVGPWIYVYNPDEGRGVRDEDLASFTARGTELLYGFENEKTRLEAEHAKSRSKSKSTVWLARKINPLRRALEEDVFALAREKNVVTGKWMLFPSAGDVDRVWEAVANATVQGELVAAKVATYDSDEDRENKKPRLLAVYTRDYEDRGDIKLVLQRLIELGVVRKDERPIYYKCDALTHLGIKSDNPYGLKASLFSSRDVFMGKI